MRIPTLAVTTVAAAALVALPTTANAAEPVAGPDSFQTEFETAKSINVLTNDSDADLNSLTVTAQTDGTHGTASCTGAGLCTYTPDDNWSGSDSFTYTVTDGSTPVTGTVTVKTVKVSTVSLGFTPANVTWSTAADADNTVKAVGTVRQSATVFLGGVEVQLWQRPSGTTVFSQVPDTGTKPSAAETGKVSWAGLTPTPGTTYQLRTAGDVRSNTRTVSVTPSLKVDYSSKKQALGRAFTVSGESAPATQGAEVRLQRRTATGWVLEDTTTFGTPDPATKVATFGFDPLTHASSGSVDYRVLVPASGGMSQVVSGQTTVRTYDADIVTVEPTGDEFVKVKNIGTVSINLQDWVLSQGASTVTLPKRSLGANGTVWIHSGRGVNDSKNLYLKKADPLWANNNGTVTLKDNAATPFTVDTFTYGP